MGKRFKVALAVAGCFTLLLAILGPILAAFLVDELRILTLTVWAAVFGVWIVGILSTLLIKVERRAVKLLSANRGDRAVIAEIRDVRLKQSRHEFKQKLLLDRIEASTSTLLGDIDSLRAAEIVPDLERIPWHGGKADGRKVLFITSNGSGMGHLSRCLAVAFEAEKAECRTAILTLSTAYQVVRESGYPVMYHPSSAASPWSISVWNRSFARFLEQRFKEDPPDIVVFDGTAVYRGVTQVCRRREIPLVWLRRGMWKRDVTRVQYDRPFEVADFVVVPGEVNGEAPHDQSSVLYVGPVSQANQFKILDAPAAKRSLGLDPEGRYALVQVGSAQMAGRSVVNTIVKNLKRSGAEQIPVVMVSPVAAREAELSGGIVVHGRYPLAPYLKAFDFAVTSAGYNSVHENLAVGLPAVYVPNTSAVTDDQTARAELVEQAGLGIVVRDETELKTALTNVADSQKREGITDALSVNGPTDGAEAIVQSLSNIVDRTEIGVLHPGIAQYPIDSGR